MPQLYGSKNGPGWITPAGSRQGMRNSPVVLPAGPGVNNGIGQQKDGGYRGYLSPAAPVQTSYGAGLPDPSMQGTPMETLRPEGWTPRPGFTGTAPATPAEPAAVATPGVDSRPVALPNPAVDGRPVAPPNPGRSPFLATPGVDPYRPGGQFYGLDGPEYGVRTPRAATTAPVNPGVRDAMVATMMRKRMGSRI